MEGLRWAAVKDRLELLPLAQGVETERVGGEQTDTQPQRRVHLVVGADLESGEPVPMGGAGDVGQAESFPSRGGLGRVLCHGRRKPAIGNGGQQ